MTVLCSAVHSWDFRTFISTSSCRREKALVPPVLIRDTHEQQREEEEILIFCLDETFLRIWMWSTILHVLNVKTSVNPASLCNPFCLPQHFLHGRWHTESWLFLSKASASLPGISPTCPPTDNGMQSIICVVLGAHWHPRFGIDNSTSFSFNSSLEEMNHRIMLPCSGQLSDTYTESRRLGNISSTFQYTILAQVAAQVALVEQTNN